MAHDYGLLIASLVAIVAIVGLVILFSGGAETGNLSLSPFDQYNTANTYWDLKSPDVDRCGGKNVADGCVDKFGKPGTCVSSIRARPNWVCGVDLTCLCRT